MGNNQRTFIRDTKTVEVASALMNYATGQVPEKERRWPSTGFVCNIEKGDLMRTSPTCNEVVRATRLFVVIGCMCLFFAFIALFPLTATEQSEDKKKSEQFSATAFGQSGCLPATVSHLNIYINENSGYQEVEELATTLKTKGPDALLRAVQKMKEKGRVATTGRVGWRVPLSANIPPRRGAGL